MVKLPNQEEDEPYTLKWKWKGDDIVEFTPKTVKGLFKANQLLDHKQVSNASSDYLWYLTRYIYL